MTGIVLGDGTGDISSPMGIWAGLKSSENFEFILVHNESAVIGTFSVTHPGNADDSLLEG